MSDGNFNRSLLPYRNYTSGVRAGRMQMKIKALKAFRDCLAQEEGTCVTEEKRKQLEALFCNLLDE